MTIVRCLAFLLSLLTCSLQANSSSSCLKAITFDFGGVIARTDLKFVTDFISQSLNIPCEQAAEVLVKWRQEKQNRANQEQFWHDFANSLGKALPSNWIDQFKHVWSLAIQPIPGMLSLVQDLQAMGYQTAMLSNTTPMHAEVIDKLGYYQFFCPVLLSFQIRVAKPHNRAYEILLESLERPASECIFIDDKEENVAAARALGIDAIQFFSAEQLQEELEERNIFLLECASI